MFQVTPADTLCAGVRVIMQGLPKMFHVGIHGPVSCGGGAAGSCFMRCCGRCLMWFCGRQWMLVVLRGQTLVLYSGGMMLRGACGVQAWP